MRDFFSFLLLLKLASCVFTQVTLDQSTSVFVTVSETLKLSCKLSISVSSYDWAWVRQTLGKGLEHMGYLNTIGSSYPAPSFQSQVTFTRDTSRNEVYLQMINMKIEDHGTYYCAKYTVAEGSED
uniref:Ig-like domain-containing protein n=1 Tax=Xenopus tropicalis TaxID=8364 RepID=A0A803KEX0_XENTR